MKDERLELFQLSDAPIHRIQTLVFELVQALRHIPGFDKIQPAFFVRRDFDTQLSNKCPVFNGTFYHGEVGSELGPEPLRDFVPDALEKLHKLALNSASTPRGALERAIRKLRELHAKTGNLTEVEKQEYSHHWLELFSRVSYSGGVASYLIGKSSALKVQIPALSWVTVNDTGKLDDKGQKIYEDRIVAYLADNGEQKKPKNGKTVQPPLRTSNDNSGSTQDATTAKSENDLSHVLYLKLQPWIEHGLNPNARASDENSLLPETHLLALPIHEYFHVADSDRSVTPFVPPSVTPCGPFLGFLFLVLDSAEKGQFKQASESFYLAAPHLTAFANSLLESEFEEILREDFSGDDPHQFLIQHIHRIQGGSARRPSPTDSPQTDSDNSLVIVCDLAPELFQESKDSTKIILDLKDDWSRMPETNSEVMECYKIRVCRRHRYYDELATLQLSHRKIGQQKGFLASAHDYSKEIGSACLRLQEFAKDLEGGQRTILERSRQLAELPAPAPAIGEQINLELTRCFQPPSMDWFSAVQFTHAHLKTQTYGPITGEPIECVAMVETGTLRGIYSLVRSLVWMPLHYVGYKELEQDLQAAKSPEIDNPLTWAALFRYDMRPTEATGTFHQMLGDRIIQIIRKESTEGADFLRSFPAPEINPEDDDFDVPLLWSKAEPASRYSPIERLLPLLVFSLRFAYQCAWAKTLLAEASGSFESINISATNTDTRTRRIEISFAAPTSSHQGHLENIPYYLEWRQQMSHYTGRTYPWKDVGTDSVTLDSKKHRITLALTASI